MPDRMVPAECPRAVPLAHGIRTSKWYVQVRPSGRRMQRSSRSVAQGPDIGRDRRNLIGAQAAPRPWAAWARGISGAAVRRSRSWRGFRYSSHRCTAICFWSGELPKKCPCQPSRGKRRTSCHRLARGRCARRAGDHFFGRPVGNGQARGVAGVRVGSLGSRGTGGTHRSSAGRSARAPNRLPRAAFATPDPCCGFRRAAHRARARQGRKPQEQ